MKILVYHEIGRPKNPFEEYQTNISGDSTWKRTDEWKDFEQSVTTYPAPGLDNGEFEAELVWQMKINRNNEDTKWTACEKPSDENLKSYPHAYRQIYRLSPALKEEGVKQDGIDEFELNDMHIRFDNKKGLLYITQGDDEIILTEREWLKLKELLSILSL